MIRKILYAALAATALMSGAARAEETVVWWDFLGGGDGVRMKKLIEDFNAEHADKIEIQGTTLDWGTPFYAKVQTSTAIGEGPDIMTYHASRLPLGVSQGVLSEITDADMKTMGLAADSFVKRPGTRCMSTASSMPCRSTPIRSSSTTTRTSSRPPA